MAEIDIRKTEHDDTYEFDVTVRERDSQTRHTVSLSKADYDRLTEGEATAEALVRESFRFLLERESKESILRSFDLTVISRYFPEYERTIKQRV